MKDFPDLERIENPSQEEFVDNYLHQHKPVVITNAVNMEGYKQWQGDYINAKIGTKPAHCLKKDKGKYTRACMKTMLVSEFIEHMAKGDSIEERYYLRSSIKEEYPELLDDIEEPKYIVGEKDTQINIWYGWGGNKAPLHYDARNNFLLQVRGEKKLLLFPGSERKHLYPNSMFHDFPHFSQADITPDMTAEEIYAANPKFKNIKKAEGYKVKLNPGDMLYMPAFCWHSAVGFGENIALNFWWRYKMGNDYLPYPNYLAHHPGFILAALKEAVLGKKSA